MHHYYRISENQTRTILSHPIVDAGGPRVEIARTSTRQRRQRTLNARLESFLIFPLFIYSPLTLCTRANHKQMRAKRSAPRAPLRLCVNRNNYFTTRKNHERTKDADVATINFFRSALDEFFDTLFPNFI